MALNTYTLENLTLTDLPPVWIKKFHLLPGQCFTVRITSEDVSVPMPIKPVSKPKDRVALMRKIEKELSGTEYEDSEELIKAIKETRTISEPKHIF